MLNQPLIKRRKIETVFLGTIDQIVDNAALKNSSIKHQTEEITNPQLEDENSCEFQVGTSLNQSNNNTSLKSNILTAENEYKCSINDSTGDYSMDSDFFVMYKPKTVIEKEIQIPEITDSTRITLRPIPPEAKLIYKENNTLFLSEKLETPKEISIQLEQRSICSIINVQVINQHTINNSVGKNLLKCAKICGKSENEDNCWEVFVKSKVSLISANYNWTVATCENHDLVMISTKTGSVQRTLRLDCFVSILLLHENICLVILKNTDIISINLESGKIIMRKSLSCLLKTKEIKILHYGVSESGIPMIFLSNEDCVVYSKQINVNTGIGALSIFIAPLKFIASIVPNGLIALLSKHKSNAKEKWDLNPETNAICEENQFEYLLEACQALDSYVEFRLIFYIYIEKLVKREKYEKVVEAIEDVKRFCKDSEVLELLKDIEPILNDHGTTYNKLLTENKKIYVNLSFID